MTNINDFIDHARECIQIKKVQREQQKEGNDEIDGEEPPQDEQDLQQGRLSSQLI